MGEGEKVDGEGGEGRGEEERRGGGERRREGGRGHGGRTGGAAAVGRGVWAHHSHPTMSQETL